MTNEQLLEEFRKSQNLLIQHMDERFEQVDERFEQVDKRFEQVDERFEQVDKRFEQVEEHLEQLDEKFKQMDVRFEALENRVTDVEVLIENEVIPNVREMAACYTSTYETYVKGISRDEDFRIRFETLCDTVADHSRILKANGLCS